MKEVWRGFINGGIRVVLAYFESAIHIIEATTTVEAAETVTKQAASGGCSKNGEEEADDTIIMMRVALKPERR